jgi:predicted ATPase/DNA-binding SARP family transcriptional activator
MLNIHLLGDFRLVNEDGVVATFTTSRMQSLLAYLVLHRDAPQPRRRIACLLWPDSVEEQARTNLRNLIYLLHQSFPDAAKYFSTDGPTIQWKPDSAFMLDVAELEKAMAAGEFETVIDLYAGDLLPDCYDEWAVIKREELRQMYAVSLEHLLKQKELEHAYHAAMGLAQRLIRYEPLQEQTYRKLMHLCALNGDYTGIIRAYNMCVTVLQNELGIEPSNETRKMYASCLKMHSQVDANSLAVTPQHPDFQTNLPHQVTTFIGRAHEKTEVRELVTRHRLVSLVGAGGVGKTRLALAVAEDLSGVFVDGVWYLDLALLADPTRVVQAVSYVMGLREEGKIPLLSRLTDHLLKMHILLLLDNCESVIEAVRYLTESLLHAVPNISFLITSRDALKVQDEVIWRVPSLSTPDMSHRDFAARTQPDNLLGEKGILILREYESVQFFADRAAAVLPTFAITSDNAWYIGRICQQLDGIPLALELAAARVKLLTIQQIADHLTDALHILTQGDPTALPHHQTMQATLDWSHNRLAQEEQILFRRLSVFFGGATLDAVEDICSGNGMKKDQIFEKLSVLVDKSLVQVEPLIKCMRFRLHEITRQYAYFRLKESGEFANVKKRHLEYFCCLTESMESGLAGEKSAESSKRQTMELANTQAALRWSTLEPGNSEFGLRIATASIDFFEERGLIAVGRQWLEKLLVMVDTDSKPVIRARALTALGRTASIQGDFEVARASFEQSLVIYRELKNTSGMAENLSRLGGMFAIQMKTTTAIHYLEESLELYRSLGNQGGLAYVLHYLAYVYFFQGEYTKAHSFINESQSFLKSVNMEYLEAQSKYLLGLLARSDKNYPFANTFFSEATNTLFTMGNFGGVIILLGALGGLHAEEKRFELAARIFGAVEYLCAKLGASLTPAQHMDLERDTNLTRMELGEEAFAMAWAEGHTLTLEQAVDCALEVDS